MQYVYILMSECGDERNVINVFATKEQAEKVKAQFEERYTSSYDYFFIIEMPVL